MVLNNVQRKSPAKHLYIVGGTPALRGEFPALGAMRDDSGVLVCGGTLIAPSHVLTAAHCLSGLRPEVVSRYSLIFNSLTWNGGTGSVARTVKRAIIHENWNPVGTKNDIAIVVLNSPITTIAFTKLPTDSTALTTKKPTTKRPTTKLPTTKRPTTKAPCSCTCWVWLGLGFRLC
ncbi:chymotrypsin-C-like [Daphnia magna]|uniref:chymotrypsin-C-like n=1 Tax=Daphnia magna TaxID=35525 RepID=UPI001E1BB043|nr:chymotrypsin-C-like [Daphnia magna]